MAATVLDVVSGASATGAAACPATVAVPGKTSPRYYPPLVSGDRDFGGHGPAITVSAKRQLWTGGSPDRLDVVVTMKAEETQSDWTTARGTKFSFTLYTAPAGCRIDTTTLSGSFDSNGYLARPLYANPYALPAGNTDINKSFVLGYTVWDDRTGSDVTDYTSMNVTTRPFNLRFTN